MTVSQKIWTKKSLAYKYLFSAGFILFGLILNFFKIGIGHFAGFNSVGSWVIYAGFLIAIIATIIYKRKKKKIIDERMEKIGYHASRLTVAIFFISLFILMIVDGIYQITIRYYLFISYIICFYLIIYFIAYKILERKY
ncbi:MAG: DUF2178 domain-containing protein [Candidatus Pacearchaeota archaeon]|nr:DUF2178 domain-containing protein [Candidatus Pacearchaeota archaeon]